MGLPQNPSLERMIEQKLRNWELARSQQTRSSEGESNQCAQFVALSNNVGSGGGDIATRLGEQLDWPVFDRQILEMMADNDSVRTRLYRSVDERKLGFFEETFRSLMQGEFHKNDYVRHLTETILCLNCQGPAVFVGRAADQILPQKKGLRVKVTCSLERRIQNLAEHSGLGTAEATRQVKRIDRERSAFVRSYFNADPETPSRFVLLLNMEHFSTTQAVELILTAIRMHGITDSKE